MLGNAFWPTARVTVAARRAVEHQLQPTGWLSHAYSRELSGSWRARSFVASAPRVPPSISAIRGAVTKTRGYAAPQSGQTAGSSRH